MRDVNGNVPEGRWHLSDKHGDVVMFGPDRWLEPTAPERGSGALNRWTHAELSALVDDLNGAAQKVEAYEDLIASLWGDIDGYYGPRYRDDGLLDEVLASVKARGGRS